MTTVDTVPFSEDWNISENCLPDLLVPVIGITKNNECEFYALCCAADNFWSEIDNIIAPCVEYKSWEFYSGESHKLNYVKFWKYII